MDFSIDGDLDTAAITCCHIVDETMLIRHVCHDKEGGMIRLLPAGCHVLWIYC